MSAFTSGSSSGEFSNTLGRHIRAARIDAELSFGKLAALTGLSRPHLHDIETGRRKPSEAALARIARPLELDTAFLLALAGQVSSAVSAYLKANPHVGVRLSAEAAAVSVCAPWPNAPASNTWERPSSHQPQPKA